MAGAEEVNLRKYLIGQLTEAEEEQIEIRLLSDSDFAEEFDIVVDEITDDYVAGKFPTDERKQVEQHFFKAPERQHKLKFALALKARKSEISADKDKRRWFLPYLAIAASLVLVGGGFYIWRLQSNNSELNNGLAALQAAYREQRPLESRLSDFSYAPMSNQRGGPARIDYLKRDLAASILLKEVADHPSPRSHHALGQYYLAEHQFDKAIDQLKAALALDPQDAKIHSDLGAALLESGKTHLRDSEQGKGIEELAESLSHLNKALELANPPLEPLFNRALVHEYMALPTTAEEDWRSYLQLDPNSKWAEEARDHLARVEGQKKRASQGKEEIFQQFLKSYESRDDEVSWRIISSYHNRTGNVVVEQLLDFYLGDIGQGRRDEASRNLQMLSYVGGLEKRRADDSFFSDLASLYGSVSPERLTALARARGLMKKAHEDWGRANIRVSISQFSEAKLIFERAGDIGEASVAGYWVSFCHYHQHDSNRALEILQPSVAISDAKSYKWLTVRTLYLTSILQYDLTKYSEAIEIANRSLELARRTGDVVGELNALTSLIEYYRFLSNFRKSLDHLQNSLSLLNLTALDSIQGCRIFGFMAISLAAAGLYDAAAVYQEEALRYALETKRPATISYNLAFLGQIDGKLKKFDVALSNVRRAFEIAQAQSDDEAGLDRMAYSSLQMGDLYRQAGDFGNAIESYDRSITLYKELDFSTHLYHARKGRLICYVEQGNDHLAEEEISAAVNLAESYRDNIFEEDNRNTFFDAEQSLYDVAIGFHYSRRNDSEKAFEFSELSHSRSLLDLMNSDRRLFAKSSKPNSRLSLGTRPLSLVAIRSHLPEQTQILQFAVLEDQLLLWVIGKEARIMSAQVPIARKDLERKVGDYLQLLSSAPTGRTEELLRLARDLYDILIGPAEPFLDRGKLICIVPDKILNLIPYATLVSRISGKYVIEDFVLEVSPSSTMFIACTEIARGREGTDAERILSVGNPGFDGSVFTSLPDLPSAAKEASDIATLYNSKRLLVGDEATVKQVERVMKDSDVIHLALHSVLDERLPLRSKFVFAKDSNGANGTQKREPILFAYEIYGMSLPRTRLAVLSSCQTAAGPYLGGEGVLNMARPFIVAGVPLVVASLWPVDSDSTAALMVNFHRLRTRGGLRSAEALRQAQLEMMSGPDTRLRQPYHWAPFVLIGGQANF